MLSVNTNQGAMVALQTLNKTNSDLDKTQNAISTGLKVATAKDNGAIWAIANKMMRKQLWPPTSLNCATKSPASGPTLRLTGPI